LLFGNVSVKEDISVGSVGKKYVVGEFEDRPTSEELNLSSTFAARYLLIILGG
jgi:hypothetical protein